ncbi:MAG: phosphate ABC transporter permease PstA [Myxococcota bacterium]
MTADLRKTSIRWGEVVGPSVLAVAALICVAFLVLLVGYVMWEGGSVLSWTFISQPPRDGMTEGGIWPAIVGTVLVTLVSALAAVPLGVAAAIYLAEYAPEGVGTRLIRLSVRNLAGVPSIVYGLFGLALFVQALELGGSVLSSGLTLGLLNLPWTISASEEALRTVPRPLRDGALALGAGRWAAIRTVVLPSALPGIITGAVLALARAAGETAPILFTGVAFYLPVPPRGPADAFMALPYHLYVMATQHHDPLAAQPLAFGTALVLILLVFTLSSAAVVLRSRIRRQLGGGR